MSMKQSKMNLMHFYCVDDLSRGDKKIYKNSPKEPSAGQPFCAAFV